MKAQDIRQKFSDFFQRHGHQKVESSPLIPQNDPTLLFANAGMNQFKDYFTGKDVPKFKRAVSIQKCVRAGGKHNDLENVGFTARHHTFFEMLGNFSFGDYFKKEAIAYAWEFLTVDLKIPKEKLIVTVHSSDDEAALIWEKDIGIPKEKIFRKGDKDNFWEMGEFGPCGPCSEIFYDHGPSYQTPGFVPTPQEEFDDGGRYVEIWNLVFMQYEKTPQGRFNLPKPSIDTGAGLERIAAAMQGLYWNYDTDVFKVLIKKIESLSSQSYSNEKWRPAFRVVCDHARACTMLITDGVIPSNEGRGYVLRRIIRRAVKYLKELGTPAGSFYQLVDAVFEDLGQEYPQNKANKELAQKLLKLEENKFLETLDHGLKFLNEAIESDLKHNVLPGHSVFKLYDTYGFPVDLTELILKERGLKTNMDEFEKLMSQRKEESKKTWKGGEMADNQVFFELKEKFGLTKFLGYETVESQAKLLFKQTFGESTALIFDQTPFYGESGGQSSDIGQILLKESAIADIFDVQRPVDGFFVHFSLNADLLSEGETYTLKVNKHHRDLTARNHSATHLLQAALIEVLGNHVKQSGSHVSNDRLRFDFTHPEGMTEKQIHEVENLVNQKIQQSMKVCPEIMTKDQALKKGAQALFGEKYGDQVRVISMGEFSLELCGGTHVANTAEIGFFNIISESALSSGIRRIEALSSEGAIGRLQERSNILKQIESLTKLKDENVPSRIETILKEGKDKQKEIVALKDQLQVLKAKTLLTDPQDVSGYKLKMAQAPEDADLKKLSDLYFDQYSNGILLLYHIKNDKLAALLRCPKSDSHINCSNLLSQGLLLLDGRGGGKSDLAQGSAPKVENLKKFIDEMEKIILSTLKK